MQGLGVPGQVDMVVAQLLTRVGVSNGNIADE